MKTDSLYEKIKFGIGKEIRYLCLRVSCSPYRRDSVLGRENSDFPVSVI